MNWSSCHLILSLSSLLRTSKNIFKAMVCHDMNIRQKTMSCVGNNLTPKKEVQWFRHLAQKHGRLETHEVFLRSYAHCQFSQWSKLQNFDMFKPFSWPTRQTIQQTVYNIYIPIPLTSHCFDRITQGSIPGFSASPLLRPKIGPGTFGLPFASAWHWGYGRTYNKSCYLNGMDHSFIMDKKNNFIMIW